MEECKAFIHGGLLDDQHRLLRFAWNEGGPGNGKTRACFKCISHIDCPVVVRAVRRDGVFSVQTEAEVEHTKEERLHQRSNSSLDVNATQLMKSLVNAGCKPGSIHSTLTSQELERIKSIGEVVQKRADGGVQGEHCKQHTKHTTQSTTLCIPSTTCAVQLVTGVANLKAVQNKVARMKKKRVAGVQIINRSDLLEYTQKLELPALPALTTARQLTVNPSAAAAKALVGREYVCIPQVAANFNVDGACFSGPVQIRWVQQLSRRPGQFTLHMDGKYKLHHGLWILISLGTHTLKAVGKMKVSRLSTTFVPLVYLFCKNHESTGEFFNAP